MTQDFEHMLRLFGAGALGYEIDKIENINIEKIRSLAIEQGIWHTVYAYMVKQYDMSAYQKEFLATVTSALQRREYTLGIIAGLEKIGIKCCLIKGVVIAQLYAQPDCRVSGDTDILINPDDEEKVKIYLIQKGYSVEKREKNDHHMKAYHPIGGLLEVHVRLYSILTEKLIFNNIVLYNEEWRIVEINNNKLYTLGINDGLLYLTAHYIKHLVNEGGGVRQMMDLLLYMEYYRDSIDFNRYNDIMKKLRYDKLVDVIKTVGAKYWNMDYSITDESLAEEILSDSEKGGIFGFETKERNGFYDTYCRRRHKGSVGVKVILNTKKETSLMGKIFPNRYSMMERGYTHVDNISGLFAAWVLRWFKILLRKSSKDKPDTSQRLKLMQDLNMID